MLYNDQDPEWVRWCNYKGFCNEECYRAYEAILEIGEDEYYQLVEEFENETDYGEGMYITSAST